DRGDRLRAARTARAGRSRGSGRAVREPAELRGEGDRAALRDARRGAPVRVRRRMRACRDARVQHVARPSRLQRGRDPGDYVRAAVLRRGGAVHDAEGRSRARRPGLRLDGSGSLRRVVGLLSAYPDFRSTFTFLVARGTTALPTPRKAAPKVRLVDLAVAAAGA